MTGERGGMREERKGEGEEGGEDGKVKLHSFQKSPPMVHADVISSCAKRFMSAIRALVVQIFNLYVMLAFSINC